MTDFTDEEVLESIQQPSGDPQNNDHKDEGELFMQLIKEEDNNKASINPVPEHANANEGLADARRSKKISNYEQFKASVKDMISKNPREPEVRKQFLNVIIFGMTFFLIRSSFLTPCNMTPQIFELEGKYYYLGEIMVMLIYGFYGLSSVFHTTILQRVPLKICLILGGFTFPVFNIGGFYAMSCVDVDSAGCSKTLIYVINIICAMACGSLMGLLWTVQSEYVSSTAPPGKIGLFMGVFYAFAQAAQALSTVLSLLLILYVTKSRYYLYLFCIGIVFMCGLFFIPTKKHGEVKVSGKSGMGSMGSQLIPKEGEKPKKPTLWFNISAIFLLLKRKRVRVVTIFWASTGLVIAFYGAFLYKIINLSIANDPNLNDQENNENLEKKAAYVFILLGVSEFIGGFMVSYVADRIPVYLCALFGQLLIEVSLICTMMAYNLENYTWCFIAAFFWGIADCFIRSLSNVLCKNECKKEDGLAGFSLYRFFFGIGSIIVVVLGILLNDYKNYFMIIIFLLQMLGVMSVGYLLWDEKEKLSASIKASVKK